jgi:hypothetical protein
MDAVLPTHILPSITNVATVRNMDMAGMNAYMMMPN